MKNLCFIAFIAIATQIFGQANITPTESFKVSGLVKKEVSISILDLKKYPTEKISSVKLTNHKNELKAKLKGLRGVPLISVLKNLEIEAESPKVLSEFYLIFRASDGYKVVYSWNEIFNSEIGQESYFITEKNGVSVENMPERILILTPEDFQTGRRHLKSLAEIIVKRCE